MIFSNGQQGRHDMEQSTYHVILERLQQCRDCVRLPAATEADPV